MRKLWLLLAAVLLVVLIGGYRWQVKAQGSPQYKVVDVEVYESVETGLFRSQRLITTQSVLDQYAKEGWELVTASYYDDPHSSGRAVGKLIFHKR